VPNPVKTRRCWKCGELATIFTPCILEKKGSGKKKKFGGDLQMFSFNYP